MRSSRPSASAHMFITSKYFISHNNHSSSKHGCLFDWVYQVGEVSCKCLFWIIYDMILLRLSLGAGAWSVHCLFNVVTVTHFTPISDFCFFCQIKSTLQTFYTTNLENSISAYFPAYTKREAITSFRQIRVWSVWRFDPTWFTELVPVLKLCVMFYMSTKPSGRRFLSSFGNQRMLSNSLTNIYQVQSQ